MSNIEKKKCWAAGIGQLGERQTEKKKHWLNEYLWPELGCFLMKKIES